ncbi:hypothetical protein D3C73_954140 [compost metagenome]
MIYLAVVGHRLVGHVVDLAGIPGRRVGAHAGGLRLDQHAMVRGCAAPLRVGDFQRDAIGDVLRAFRRDEAGLGALLDKRQHGLATPGIGQVLAGRFGGRQLHLVARIHLRRTDDVRLRHLATDAVAAQQFCRANQIGLHANGAGRIGPGHRIAAIHQHLPHDLGRDIAQAAFTRQALQPGHATRDDRVGGRRAAVAGGVQVVLPFLPVRGGYTPAPTEHIHAATILREPRHFARHGVGRAYVDGA